MKIQLLGTGGYHPSDVRQTASFLLPEAGIALDAGTGIYRLPAAMQTEDLHLFLSHPHWDHIIGLTYLYVPLLTGQIRSVTLYGNAHTFAAISTHLFAEPTFSHMPDFQFVLLEDLSESKVELNGVQVSWQPLPSHPGGSTAYLLEDGRSRFAYVTDTFVDGSYHELIQEVDLLIHECYFSDELSEWAEKTGHSYLSQVASLARDCRVKQLLLTHVDPRENEESPWDLTAAREIFPLVDFARDQTLIQLPGN